MGEAKGIQASLRVQMAPAAASTEVQRVQLLILSIHCAERITRDEAAILASLTARAAELHAMSRTAVAHVN